MGNANHPNSALDRKRKPSHRLGDPAGPSDRDHVDRRYHRVGLGASLFALAIWLTITCDGEGEAIDRGSLPICRFFTFAMLVLVTSDNLIQMFFGWEGVGVASYLLIGFYYRKPSGQCCGDQSVCGQPGWGFRLCIGHFGLYLFDR